MNIAQVVKTLRTAKNFSQKELAHFAQIDSSHISHIESGTRVPSIAVLDRIAHALNVPVDILLRNPEQIQQLDQDRLYIQERIEPLFQRMYSKLETLGV